MTTSVLMACPSWCRQTLDEHLADEANLEGWNHQSGNFPAVTRVRANLVEFLDGEVDGPHVWVGDEMFTVAGAVELVDAIQAAIDTVFPGL